MTHLISFTSFTLFYHHCDSLAFAPAYPNGHTNEVFGDWTRLWLRGMTLRSFHYLAPTIPESVYCTYQLTFAIITAGLMLGAFADRMKFVPMMIFVSIWHLVVYCPMAHSNWHYQGFIKNIGALDFAGGNVVHICSGASGLATVAVVGNRKGRVNHQPLTINHGMTYFSFPLPMLMTHLIMTHLDYMPELHTL